MPYGKDTADKSKKNVIELTKGYPTYDRATGERRTIESRTRPDTKSSKFRKLEGDNAQPVRDKEKYGQLPAYGANRDRVRQTRKLEKEL